MENIINPSTEINTGEYNINSGKLSRENLQSSSCMISLARHVAEYPSPVDFADFATRLHTCTDAQNKILWLISCGLLNKQIAHRCGISEATVKSHVSAVMRKLRIRSRTAAAARVAVFLDRNRSIVDVKVADARNVIG